MSINECKRVNKWRAIVNLVRISEMIIDIRVKDFYMRGLCFGMFPMQQTSIYRIRVARPRDQVATIAETKKDRYRSAVIKRRRTASSLSVARSRRQ